MTKKTLLFRLIPACLVVAVALLTSGFLFSNTSPAGASGIDVHVLNWHPTTAVNRQLANSAALTDASAQAQSIKTIPNWTSSFKYQGTKYSYSMVGKDPSKGSSTTKVDTLLIPVKLTLSDGTVYDGASKAKKVTNSPIFKNTSFSSGNTQYGDAIQRAEFWKYVSKKSPKYHVLLNAPTQKSTFSISVPADKGSNLTLKSGKVVAGVDINFLDAQFVAYMQAHHVSPKTLPIFLTYDTFGTDNNGADCCIGGYHNAIPTADNKGIQTYAYAEYGDKGLSSTNPTLFANTDALSHEISEWYNDPFGNNAVPPWSVPSQPQYGCTSVLEVGDPLVGIGFDKNGYHLQDEAFFSWFARQSPSIGIHGRYTYLGTFTTFSPPC